MRPFLLSLFLLCAINQAKGQLYFPPVSGSTWDTMSPASLGWCAPQVAALSDFLDSTDSKAFIVLKDGKIVLEWYYDGFGVDSVWYWASAGKSLTALLCGIAQQEGHLSITDKVSTYLGAGWTSLTAAQEDSVLLLHQLCMTTGLNDNLPDDDCTADTCLLYQAPVAKRWAYHNPPYTLLQSVITAASGAPSFTNYLNTRLALRTGIQGAFIDHVMYSKPRAMARFGLLMLGNGVWQTDSIITNQNYFTSMLASSQSMNPSYGYLWWLNGKSSYMIPRSQLSFSGSLVANAPADMYAAMGKNDQRCYVIPSQNMVVVRLGNSGGTALAVSDFDFALWTKINALACSPASVSDANSANFVVETYPNPVVDLLNVKSHSNISFFQLLDLQGNVVSKVNASRGVTSFSIRHLQPGSYLLVATTNTGGISAARITKQ